MPAGRVSHSNSHAFKGLMCAAISLLWVEKWLVMQQSGLIKAEHFYRFGLYFEKFFTILSRYEHRITRMATMNNERKCTRYSMRRGRTLVSFKKVSF